MDNLTDANEAEDTLKTPICPDLVGTLPGVPLFEVYEVTVTVTNITGGCLNLGEGGEDFACHGMSCNLKTK